ncbi:hypothetical protein C8F04DRAFT_1176429 [Mycena alexandri]|uniref:Uncharacterized protein n=1 Tax=Mycena alexandri TaxID=1745969 RepID=A0AAD6TA04_9AGAR|nr:hypothetical protein C8F04DRAFT_1176429 [Mycena alexandri]
MGCGAVARQRLGLRVRRQNGLCAPPLCSAHTWTWETRSSSTLEQLEDRWSEEEREKGMARTCPDWEVERKGVQLRDHDEPEYTPSEGKGGQLRDRNKPESTPAVEIGTHLCCVTTIVEGAVSPGSGINFGVGGRVWVPVAGLEFAVIVSVASTRHIARGRRREPGDGVGVVQRRRHSREKKGWSQSHQ